jgi:hypothetical protein
VRVNVYPVLDAIVPLRVVYVQRRIALAKKLTILIEDDVYQGLQDVIGGDV